MTDTYQSTNSILTSETLKTMVFGLIIAVLINLSLCNWIFDLGWDWTEKAALSWPSTGLVYMATFFHELGHTFFAWFYGYPTLPMFDFKHGGGLALSVTDQQIALLLCLYGAIIYGMFHFKEYRWLQIMLALVLIFNLATAFDEDMRRNVIDFMGPAAEPLIAAFLLFRALYDLAPRGWFERFLNAVIGFGMIFQTFINCYGLIHSNAWRLLYYEQKGSHGFGDFDKISSRLYFTDFQGVVYVWAGLALICLTIPFIHFFFAGRPANQNL